MRQLHFKVLASSLERRSHEGPNETDPNRLHLHSYLQNTFNATKSENWGSKNLLQAAQSSLDSIAMLLRLGSPLHEA